MPTSTPGRRGPGVVDWARRAEEGPFTSLEVVDRLVYDSLDPFVALAAAAAVTTRLRLVTSCSAVPPPGPAPRHPRAPMGEAAALRRESVDLARRRLRISESVAEVGGRLLDGSTKSYAVRQLPLTPALVFGLAEHLEAVGPEPTAALFAGPEGGPLRHSNFYHRVWRPALRELDLPEVGLHVLRHSAAVRMIGAGASPKAVQAVLGHRSAAFTLTVYGHVFDADLDELAARLDGRSGPTRE